jgi:hypothetical protein
MANIGNTGVPYREVQVPSLEDNADIQNALKVYHYGTATSSPDVDSDAYKKSIAGILGILDSGTQKKDPIDLVNNENLNAKVTTGYYSQDSDSDAQSGTNYPPQTGDKYAGVLTVVNDGVLIYQTYHVSGSRNSLYFRTGNTTTNAWSEWKKVTDDTHEHNALYYLKYETYTQQQTNTELAKKPTSNITNQKIFIQQAEPTTGASDGDLWFW